MRCDDRRLSATLSWPGSRLTVPNKSYKTPRLLPVRHPMNVTLLDRGVLSKSHISPGNLARRLRIEATYPL